MVRKLALLPFFALFTGMIIVGCAAEEDYTELDTEYNTMEEETMVKYNDAVAAYDEMNGTVTSVTVADDWDDDMRTTYQTAQTRMNEYNTSLQDGKAKMDQWRVDLEAAKKEGREAYEAKLAEARTWYGEYNSWLDTYNGDVVRYRELSSAGTDTPWWYTMYAVTPSGTTSDTLTIDADGDVDDDGEGLGDKIGQAAKDVGDKIKDAGEEVGETANEAFRKATNDSDED